ncbi:MAG: PQQ-binding-like beta-propeller repeat protein [Atopobiaceae bacterium]|nr:PQQ-binding-like beta-propeller repeat protein [Atopobiaceae bacterium]
MNYNHGTAQQRTIALILALSMAGTGAPLAVIAQEDGNAVANETASESVQQDPQQETQQPSDDQSNDAGTGQETPAGTGQETPQQEQDGLTPQSEEAKPEDTESGEQKSAEAQPAGDASDSAKSDEGDAQSVKKLSVSVRVVGPDAEGNDANWLEPKTVSLEEGKNGWDASASALSEAGITFDFDNTLKSVSSPLNGTAYGADEASGKAWRLFVNGKMVKDAATSVNLAEGDAVAWYYATEDATLDDGGKAEEPKADAEAKPADSSDAEAVSRARAASWAGGRGFGTSDGALPVPSGTLAWDADLSGQPGSGSMGTPLVVDGDVYVTMGNVLCVLDGGNGAIKKTTELAGATSATTRLACADGVVMVPLDGGRVQGIAVGDLSGAWIAEGDEAAGFVGAGPAVINGVLLVASESGEITAFDPASGKVLSTVSVGGSVRSGVVPGGDGASAFVVTNDNGTLHKLSVSAEGALAEAGTVSFAAHAASAPTVCGGKVFVGGSRDDGHGVLAIIGEGSMSVEKSVTTALTTELNQEDIPAEVASSPLVSTGAGLRTYFTSASEPGALYVYEDGADAAAVLYLPDESLRQGSVSSPVAAGDGVLYSNGSGHLFKVVQGDVAPSSSGADAKDEAQKQDEAPQIRADAGDEVIARTKSVTFNIVQKIPTDATSLLLWFDLDPAMEFTTTQDHFKNNLSGVDVSFEGNHVVVRIGNENEEAAGLTAQAEEDSSALDKLRGESIKLEVSAKVRSDADLTPYVSDGNALIPYQAHARFTGAETREVASEQAVLKVSPTVAQSSTRATTTKRVVTTKPATTTSKVTTTKKATPNTADVTTGATAFSLLGGWLLLAGSTFRRWTRRD